MSAASGLTGSSACAATGCRACRHTGYQGRIGVFELLHISPLLRETLDAGLDVNRLRQQAQAEGLRSLRRNGAQKVADGLTTLAEVMRVTG